MICVNIFLGTALYQIGIVYQILLLTLTQWVYLRIDLMLFGKINYVILIIQPTWPELGVEVKCKYYKLFYVSVEV